VSEDAGPSPARPRILLLGGTSESGPLAAALLAQGWGVLVSTATDASLELPAGARRRWGRLDAPALAELCRAEGIRVLVDAGHPFATELHDTARRAAELAGLPLYRYGRPEAAGLEGALRVRDHREAAELAFSFGRPVFLSTGSRHLEPYVVASRTTGLPLFARVLDHPESLRACEAAGLTRDQLLLGRGPFDLKTHLDHLARTGAGVLVSKESGEAGGLGAKAEAARRMGIPLVLIGRPEGAEAGCSMERLEDLLKAFIIFE